MDMKEPVLPKENQSPVFSAILSRRDAKHFLEKEVEQEVLKDLLYAASWAPNNKINEPWRFCVVEKGAKKDMLGELKKSFAEVMGGENDMFKKLWGGMEPTLFAVPVFVAVAYVKDKDPVTDEENLLAVGCAVQNLLLAAEEKGLSAHWGSGKPLRTQRMKDYFGFESNQSLVALLFLGYTKDKKRSLRTPVDAYTCWKS